MCCALVICAVLIRTSRIASMSVYSLSVTTRTVYVVVIGSIESFSSVTVIFSNSSSSITMDLCDDFLIKRNLLKNLCLASRPQTELPLYTVESLATIGKHLF